jgi:hypothetical protein
MLEIMHVILLSVCECCENQRNEGCIFRMGVNEIKFYACVVKQYDILKIKNALLRPVYDVLGTLFTVLLYRVSTNDLW